MDKPILSKQAFWDVDMDKIDYEKDALTIIEKIIGWGTWEDFKTIRKLYGDKRIRKEIINTRILGDIEVNFCCVVFELKIAAFKHYKQGLLRSNNTIEHEFNYY